MSGPANIIGGSTYDTGTPGTPLFLLMKNKDREGRGESGEGIGGKSAYHAYRPDIPSAPYAQPADVIHDWQERAAVYEFDAGMNRADADLQAQCDLEARRVRP